MYPEHIQMINDWFDRHNEYGTYHHDDEYVVRHRDMSEFGDLLSRIPDLIYIPCTVGSSGIVFWTDDLMSARYY